MRKKRPGKPQAYASSRSDCGCLSYICCALGENISRARRHNIQPDFDFIEHVFATLFEYFNELDRSGSAYVPRNEPEDIDPEKDILGILTNRVNEFSDKIYTAATLGSVAPERSALREKLNDQDISSPEQVADRFESDVAYRVKLCAVFAAKGNPIFVPDRPIAPYVISKDTPYWNDLDARDGQNPVEFIKKYYGNKRPDDAWYHDNLSRSQLQRDKGLYRAYATWIGRHPEQSLTFAPSPNGGFASVDNPFEAIERRRTSQASSKRAARAKKASSPPEPV